MESFKYSKFFWKYISGLYLNEKEDYLTSVWSVILNVVHITNMIVFFCGSIALVYFDWGNISAVQLLFVFMEISGSFSAGIVYIFHCSRKPKLTESINNIQRVVNERYNRFTAEIYQRAEWKIEMLQKWSFLLMFASICGGFLVSAIGLLIYSMVRGEINVHTWPNLAQLKLVQGIVCKFHPQFVVFTPFRMPFSDYGPEDVQAHFLYLSFQIWAGSSYLILNSTSVSIFFAFHTYIAAFCQDFRNIFDRIDVQLNSKWSRRHNMHEVHKMLLDAFKFQKVIIE